MHVDKKEDNGGGQKSERKKPAKRGDASGVGRVLRSCEVLVQVARLADSQETLISHYTHTTLSRAPDAFDVPRTGA